MELPDLKLKETGKVLGVDIGVNKLIADSDGKFYGTNFKKIRDKIKRRKPGSKGKQRSIKERENFINKTINGLPWNTLKVIGIEELKNLKKGKRKGRGKKFRKAMAPWTYRQVTKQIGLKAQENRVHLVAVPSAYTSQTCPSCRVVLKENRKGLCRRVQCARSYFGDYWERRVSNAYTRY